MSLILDGTNGITNLTSINGGQLGGRRNIVYNGEMKVAQRSASETGLGAAAGYFTLDRWRISPTATAGRLTMAQVADGPAGFANCLKFTTTTADASIAATEKLLLQTKFEGQDVQQLQKGTSTAKQFTLSFYVKGNAAAIYSVEIKDTDNNRSNTQSFAVTTAWNRIELIFAGDTTGALDDDNAESISVNIWLHGGSNFTSGTYASNTWAATTNANRYAVADRTSIFDSTDRTFFITGVQMETGATATEFEHRSYGTELALCQRYYYRQTHLSGNGVFAVGVMNTTTNFRGLWHLPVTMRTSPTLSNDTVTYFTAQSSANKAASAMSSIGGTLNSLWLSVTVASGTAGQGACLIQEGDNNAWIAASAEL
jgi:hypothetical protein